MSKEVAKQIVKQANQDEAFMKKLLADPDGALQGYDLTEEERKFFRTADKKSLSGLSDKCFEIADNKKRKK